MIKTYAISDAVPDHPQLYLLLNIGITDNFRHGREIYAERFGEAPKF